MVATAAAEVVVARTAAVADPARAAVTARTSRLGSPPRGRRVPGTRWAFALGTAAGTLASVYTVSHGTNLDYGDAMAHLTIARRLLDGPNPGLQQLGTVWLPLPHLLLMPLTQDMVLFRTGIAGSILGTACLGVSSAALYRVMAHLGLGLTGRGVGLVVLLANPSLLYVSTTALTEPVLIAAVTACLAGLAGWAFDERRLSGGELAVFAGIPAAAGVLTRYEGWAMVVSGSVFVATVVLRRGDGLRRALVYVASFAAVPVAAIGWWLGYNTAWYGNPVEFLTGPYSAAAFTRMYDVHGQLTTKGNLGLSFKVLGRAMVESDGLAPLALAGVGLLLMTWRWGLDDRALLVWLAGTSSAFLLVSLATGQHIMVNDVALPSGAYNNRYVLSSVPWVALLCGFLAAAGQWFPARVRWGRVRTSVAGVAAVLVVVTGVAAQDVWWAQDPVHRMSVVEEGAVNHRNARDVWAVALWLHDHYDGGGILMDESADKLTVAPLIGVDFDEIYNRAAGAAFGAARAAPERYVRWVVMHRVQVTTSATKTTIDLVTQSLARNPQFHARYALVHAVGNLGVYRRIDR